GDRHLHRQAACPWSCRAGGAHLTEIHRPWRWSHPPMSVDLAPSSRVTRIGMMGGMFDPVHSGHLQAALTALRLLALDQLRLVPCHVPNHRGPAKASSTERLEMLQLAAADEPRLLVDPREMQ